MLILGQDKGIIVNINSVDGVVIDKEFDFTIKNDNYCKIRAVTDNIWTLGEYKTEQRAQEVLREILKHYAKNENVFEMPEE